jgi:acyl-CoA thioester hydrolase
VQAEPLQGFPVQIEIPVAWGEMDAFGHVNNIVYFRYFESARIACFNRLEYMDVMRARGIGPILAATDCRFRLPLEYPDTVTAAARVTEIGENDFVMRYLVFSHRHQRVAAEGSSRIVNYDYENKCKSPLSQELRERLARLERDD